MCTHRHTLTYATHGNVLAGLDSGTRLVLQYVLINNANHANSCNKLDTLTGKHIKVTA